MQAKNLEMFTLPVKTGAQDIWFLYEKSAQNKISKI